MNDKITALLKEKIQLIEKDGKTIYLVGPINMPMDLDGKTVQFKWYCWLKSEDKTEDTKKIVEKLSSSNLSDMQQSSVLVYGDFADSDEAYIRMHSICHTGDIFGSKRCDCGFQLKQSLRMIVANGCGALFYLANHEGRGIGLFSKAMAYVLQENGLDTVEANLNLGFEDDTRNYEDAIAVLKGLRAKPVALITNNPKKLESLKKAGMRATERIPLWGGETEFNKKYLKTKIERSGHIAQG